LDGFLPTLRVPLLGEPEIANHVRLARKLYVMLLGPALDLIQDKHHLVIVPDGDLYYLPFEALIAEERKPEQMTASLASQACLGKTYRFSYAPWASVLVTIQRDARKNQDAKATEEHPLLAFGDPTFGPSLAPTQAALSTRGAYEEVGVSFGRLPYSGEEIRRIAAVYALQPGSSINLGKEATKRRLEEVDFSVYRNLHFAPHRVLA